MRGGMDGVSVDMAGALALAEAQGVEPPLAATLLVAAAQGIRAGVAESLAADRAAREGQVPNGDPDHGQD